MTATAPRRMTAAEFLDWAAAQPGRHELHGGEVYAMAPERNRHALAKAAAFRAFDRAIAAAGLPCTVFPDGASVAIDDATLYEPDLSVTCAGRIDPDALTVPEPVVVLEVFSPSSRTLDGTRKLAGYLALASVRHYVLVDADLRAVIHHARDADGSIRTALLREGALTLDPPGFVVAVADLFPAV
jgi:Uma2 family endonuclease